MRFLLPDLEKVKKKEKTAEENLKVNSVLSALTGIVSVSLAIALYAIFLGKESTHFIIYLTAGFLIAIFGWQVQVFWRNQLLKKQIKKRRIEQDFHSPQSFESAKTKELLNDADFPNYTPTSITEQTTTKLGEKIPYKSS